MALNVLSLRASLPGGVLLALGAAVFAAGTSAYRAVVSGSIPFEEAHNVVAIVGTNAIIKITDGPLSRMDVEDLGAAPSVESIGMYAPTEVRFPDKPEVAVRASSVSEGLFRVLRLRPALGSLSLSSAAAAGEYEAVLSHRLWATRFASDPGVIGRSVAIVDGRIVIRGVLTEGPSFPEGTDIWLSLSRKESTAFRGARMWNAVARLRLGATREQAETELSGLAEQLVVEYPDTNAGSSVVVHSLADRIVGRGSRQALDSLWTAGIAVAVLVALNVAGLRLFALLRRSRELRLRRLLGAGRVQMLSLATRQAAALFCVAAVISVPLAVWALGALRQVLPPDFHRLDSIKNAPEVALLALLACAALVVCGEGLAWSAKHLIERGFALNSPARGYSTRAFLRIGQLLIAGHVALAAVGIAGSMFMLRTTRSLEQSDLGFEPRQLVGLPVSISAGSSDSRRHDFQTMTDALLRVPGVNRVGASKAPPFSTVSRRAPVVSVTDPGNAIGSEARLVTVGYFETIGTRLLEGRSFVAGDHANDVAVINRSLSRALFDNKSAIGQTISFAGDSYTVIGVVGDAQYDGPRVQAVPELYLDYLDDVRGSVTLVVRGDPAVSAQALERALAEAVPSARMGAAISFEQAMLARSQNERAVAEILTFFSSFMVMVLSTLTTSAVRVRGIAADLGVRMSLGASSWDIRRVLVGEFGPTVAAGLAVAMFVWFPAGRLLESFLFGVTRADAFSLLTVTAVVVITTFVTLSIAVLPVLRTPPVALLKLRE